MARKFCPTPQRRAFSLSPSAPLRKFRHRNPSAFICPMIGSIALRRRKARFWARVNTRRCRQHFGLSRIHAMAAIPLIHHTAPWSRARQSVQLDLIAPPACAHHTGSLQGPGALPQDYWPGSSPDSPSHQIHTACGLYLSLNVPLRGRGHCRVSPYLSSVA